MPTNPQPTDSITLSHATAEALSNLRLGDFCVQEQPERMAAVVLVLRALPDTPARFPRGKWATIQHIEEQLFAWAEAKAAAISAPEDAS